MLKSWKEFGKNWGKVRKKSLEKVGKKLEKIKEKLEKSWEKVRKKLGENWKLAHSVISHIKYWRHICQYTLHSPMGHSWL